MIIYHENCNDGLCAAAVCKIKMPSEETLPCAAGKVEQLKLREAKTGEDIWLVDLSVDRSTVDQWFDLGYRTITMMDHHKLRPGISIESLGRYTAIYDQKRSGAKIAADYFKLFKGTNPGMWLIDYVQDRDLWTWELPNSREINAWLGMQERTVEHWVDMLQDHCNEHSHEHVKVGSFLIQQMQGVVEMQAKKAEIHTETLTIATGVEREVTYAKLPCTAFPSETGEYVLQQHPEIDVVFLFNGQTVSLRSRGQFDCAAYCQVRGGGGHVAAAGFSRALELQVG